MSEGVLPKVLLTAQYGLSAGAEMHGELSRLAGEKALQKAGIAQFKQERSEKLMAGVNGQESLSTLEEMIRKNDLDRTIRLIHHEVSMRRGRAELAKRRRNWQLELQENENSFNKKILQRAAEDAEAQKRFRAYLEAQQNASPVPGAGDSSGGEEGFSPAVQAALNNRVNTISRNTNNDRAAVARFYTDSRSGYSLAMEAAVTRVAADHPGMQNYIADPSKEYDPTAYWELINRHFPGALPPLADIQAEGARISDLLSRQVP